MNLLTLIRNIVIVLMALLILIIVLLAIPYSVKSNIQAPEKECIDVKTVKSLDYSACYDAFTKNIFLEVRNSNLVDNSTIIRFTFFDYLSKTFEVDVPKFNSSSFNKLAADRNPFAAEIYLIDSDKSYCMVPLDIKIDYCSDSNDSENSTISLITETLKDNFTAILGSGGDQFALSLVDADRVWETVCKSNWNCGPWTECIDGYQKRECVDTNECNIPTNVPQRVKSCNGNCIENWKCEWSKCTGGYTTPTCEDINRCGTSVNKPSKIECGGDCTPNFICSEWGPCSASYDFLTLSNGDYSFKGIQDRVCVDQNNCESEKKESQECLLVVDVYTKSFEKCGKEYLGIYDKLDNKLLANIEKDEERDVLNIDLTGGDSEFYCDYCFDGVLNGDEEQIDCGGSCYPCSERYIDPTYSQNIFERVLESIFNYINE